MLRYVVVISLIGFVFSAPAGQESGPKSLLEDAVDVYASCASEPDVSVCLKLKALRFVDRVARSADISIVDGLKIVQTEEAKRR